MRHPLALARTAAVVALICSFAIPAWSQANPDELARRHFESGAAYFEQAEYDSALREFRKSYELSRRPEILINVATVQERLGDLASAIAALDEYLQVKSDPEQNASIRLRRDNLQKRLDEQTPPATAEPEPAAAPPPTPVADEPEGPNRVPAYVLFSVAGASAAGAVLTGVFANAEFEDLKDRCAPNCSDGEVSGARTLATVSTVLTGAAVLSAGLGVVFWLNADGEPQQPKTGFNTRLEVTAGGAMARAGWVF
ncbi:MAG TPA: tetratricopeptide repeat protein [Polyangiaceae bacterium]|nr:tetratricopeptide repeat protein [Polyangiaceae bacterium]